MCECRCLGYPVSFWSWWRCSAVPRRPMEVSKRNADLTTHAAEAGARLLSDGCFHSQRTLALIPFWNDRKNLWNWKWGRHKTASHEFFRSRSLSFAASTSGILLRSSRSIIDLFTLVGKTKNHVARTSFFLLVLIALCCLSCVIFGKNITIIFYVHNFKTNSKLQLI